MIDLPNRRRLENALLCAATPDALDYMNALAIEEVENWDQYSGAYPDLKEHPFVSLNRALQAWVELNR